MADDKEVRGTKAAAETEVGGDDVIALLGGLEPVAAKPVPPPETEAAP